MRIHDKKDFLVIIPARYSSSRFPGKPLAKIGGVEMIVRVCRQVAKTGLNLAVATDSDRIAACVASAGFKAVMTSQNHHSGTERVEEAFRILKSEAKVVINVQGDEPFIDPCQIDRLVDIFRCNHDADIATLVHPFDTAQGIAVLEDPNLVKVVTGENHEALYFSRSVIPYVRNVPMADWPGAAKFYTHIGIYAYRSETLAKIVKLAPTPLEMAENLEQLRWLQNGFRIITAETNQPVLGIDTLEDLDKAEKFFNFK